MSTTAPTCSSSNQRFVIADATSTLCLWSPKTTRIFRPSTSPPKSSTAISAATTEPAPEDGAYKPLISVSTPILIAGSRCCARAASGRATAAPPRSAMNSRRLTGSSLRPRTTSYHIDHGTRLCCASQQIGRAMSALGQKQTFTYLGPMSALPPKADIETQPRDVRFVPLTSDLRLDAPQQSLLRYSMRPAAAYAI